MEEINKSNNGWLIILLSGFTTLFAGGMPIMCIPVLFSEISRDLDLTLVQLGVAWGTGGLAGMVMSPLGGIIGDRFGIKRTLTVACILGGFAGASRGLSTGFFWISLTFFFFTALQNTIVLNVHKTAAVFFSGKRLVIANGVVAAGVALGMTISALISDTIMSPLLGGWRNVLFSYGGVSIIIGFIWSQVQCEPPQDDEVPVTKSPPFLESISHIVRVKNAWLFGLANLCYSGSLMAFSGYVPLYLRSINWTPASADGALAVLNGSGMVAVIPLAILSGRLGLRKGFVIPAMLISMVCVFLMSFFEGFMIWPLVILFGLVRDGYYAVLFSMVIESKGIGPIYAGTAIGIVFSFGNLGSFIASPLGNRLAVIHPDFAFYFWAMMLGISSLTFFIIKIHKNIH